MTDTRPRTRIVQLRTRPMWCCDGWNATITETKALSRDGVSDFGVLVNCKKCGPSFG